MMMTMMMNTRPTTTFAFGSYTAAVTKQPIIKTTSATTIIRCSAISTQTDLSPIQVQKKEAVKEITGTTTTGRRGAVGLGLILAAAAATFLPQDSQAAASTVVEYTVTPSGLGYNDKVVGIGPQPTKGQLIKAHYVGKLENGTVFDSSYNRGKPLSFRVGVGEVIKGWDQGILGGDGIPPMLPGGKRSLKLPSDLAYGMRGAGCKGGTNCIIPPNSTLLFDVEFIGKA